MVINQAVIHVVSILAWIFQPVGTSQTNPELYSCVKGVVTYVYKNSNSSSPALGNQVQIRDDESGYYYRYCHMLYGSVTLNVGDRLEIGSRVGVMGNTGNSTRNTSSFRMYQNK